MAINNTTSFSGMINLQEQLTEFSKTICLLDYQFVIKGCDSGTARWKESIGNSVGSWCRASAPSLGAPLSQPFHKSINWKLSKPILLGFYGTQSPAPLFTSNHLVNALGYQPTGLKSHLININSGVVG